MNRSKFAAIAIACATTIAACGSNNPAGTTPGNAAQALAWVKCVRAHGVPAFPDPGPDGRLPNIPADIDTQAPAFRSAQTGCARLIPGARSDGSASSADGRLQLLTLARCMRSHGLPSFPDPATSAPQPAPGTRHGNAIGGAGGYLLLPPQSPALTRAAKACGLGAR
jgi:hypothetical protein